ncbi:MAG TPA: NAD-dependent epimerase/dehydratase family protein [Polyangiaceae bacterium]|nr:NAD-dependent epimerase/dehydratase family protein [Polyangiaceae bacterium]
MVTGATTPLGRSVTRALLARPGDGKVLAIGAESGAGFPSTLAAPALYYERADLTRSRHIRSLLYGSAKRHNVEVVVHAAHHRSARDVGDAVHALNVRSTRELVSLSERHPTIRRFVFLSHVDVYAVDPRQSVLITEDHPLELKGHAPQRVRDRVEADLTVCTRMGLADVKYAVLRMAEVPIADSGSQLFDYLRSRVCLRPLGFDPMLNLLSLDDAVDAVVRAVDSDVEGVLNIPGADTLPLSRVIALAQRSGFGVPGPLLTPLYGARASTRGLEFRYDMNHRRFHFSAILDGTRAKELLAYEPLRPLNWDAIAAAVRE